MTPDPSLRRGPRTGLRGGSWRGVVCLITVGLLLAGCSSSRLAPPAAPPPDRSGDVGLHAIVAVHHVRSALDTIILEYSDEVVLPDRAPEELFSFADAAARTPVRKVTQVYSSDEPAVSDRAKTAPGRFVIIQLSSDGGDAGTVVIQRGGRSVFRTDFSEVEIRQNFDAFAPDGSLLRATGLCPFCSGTTFAGRSSTRSLWTTCSPGRRATSITVTRSRRATTRTAATR